MGSTHGQDCSRWLDSSARRVGTLLVRACLHSHSRINPPIGGVGPNDMTSPRKREFPQRILTCGFGNLLCERPPMPNLAGRWRNVRNARNGRSAPSAWIASCGRRAGEVWRDCFAGAQGKWEAAGRFGRRRWQRQSMAPERRHGKQRA